MISIRSNNKIKIAEVYYKYFFLVAKRLHFSIRID